MNTPNTRHISVTFRCPAELVSQIDEIAQREAQQHCLPIDRSAILRRTLSHGLALLSDQPNTTATATAHAGR